MRKTNYWLTLFAMIVSITGCQDRNQPATVPSSTATVSPAAPAQTAVANNQTDKWLGQWNGPEGTYILLSKSDDKYVVKIQSLDGAQTYEGVSSGDRIQFERGGKTESIRAGSGQETGMKWLLEEKNCLVIKAGEGFCRK